MYVYIYVHRKINKNTKRFQIFQLSFFVELLCCYVNSIYLFLFVIHKDILEIRTQSFSFCNQRNRISIFFTKENAIFCDKKNCTVFLEGDKTRICICTHMYMYIYLSVIRSLCKK